MWRAMVIFGPSVMPFAFQSVICRVRVRLSVPKSLIQRCNWLKARELIRTRHVTPK